MDPVMLIFLVAIFGLLLFMMNKNRKRQREVTDMRTSLAVGQEVMTSSGMYGTVIAVEGNVVTIESTPGSTSKWFIQAIGKKVDPAVEYAVPDDEDTISDTEESAESSSGDSGTSTPDGFLSEDQVRRPYRDEKKD